jgi:pimeloyl-ACP methyl ester carboxylesterase
MTCAWSLPAVTSPSSSRQRAHPGATMGGVGTTNGSTEGAASEPGEARSADGSTVGYYRLGQGPPVVFLHGAGQSSANFTALARDLSDAFTVFVPDRRGRGRSGPYGDFHGLRTEIEDLSAVLDASGAHNVFGLSSGAVIAIETALVRPDITKLALYEPPLSFDGVVHGQWLPRYQRRLKEGKPGGALATVLKGTADRGSLVHLVPRSLLGAFLDFAIKRTAGRPTPPGSVSLPALIPTVGYDAQTVGDAAGPLERFSELPCDVLLLGGSRSAHNLTASLEGLGNVLPRARKVMLRGMGHTAADNSGRPGRVATELRHFFV